MLRILSGMIDFSRSPLLSALVVAALATGCAGIRAPQTSVEPDDGAASEMREGQEGSPQRAAGSVASLIGDGHYDEARVLLEERLARNPEDSQARSLLHQLTVDAQALLGPPGSEHIVVAGDSLSALADRYLGDPQLYVLLARYNGIKQPRSLTVGQRIALPRQSDAAQADDAGRRAGVSESGPVPASAAEVRRAIEEALDAGKLDVAADRLARARTAPASREWSGWLVPLGQRLEALQWQQRGVEAEARDEMVGREQALAAFERALSIRPDLEPAKTRRVALRTALVEDYHRAAVVHFRNQRIDEALALWDKALVLDPGFEPALGYRARALEIKRRLDRLEQDDSR
jgi:tetratricopeptide (TPR) repeat protein